MMGSIRQTLDIELGDIFKIVVQDHTQISCRMIHFEYQRCMLTLDCEGKQQSRGKV